MTDTDNKINTGDSVKLRSGGPWMTAGSRDNSKNFICHWFDEGHNSFSGTFPEGALVSYEPSSVRGDLNKLATNAYHAYGDKAGWKNYQGKEMPQWKELPDNIKVYWEAAVGHVVDEVMD